MQSTTPPQKSTSTKHRELMVQRLLEGIRQLEDDKWQNENSQKPEREEPERRQHGEPKPKAAEQGVSIHSVVVVVVVIMGNPTTVVVMVLLPIVRRDVIRVQVVHLHELGLGIHRLPGQ